MKRRGQVDSVLLAWLRTPNNAPDHVRKALESPSRPLGIESRACMEGVFGTDLGHVQIHTNAAAAISCELLGARAYTVAHHIIFGFRQYNWRNHEGKRLLTHELVHVLQQDDAIPDNRVPLQFGTKEDGYEQQAEDIENLALWADSENASIHRVTRIAPLCDVALYRATKKVCVPASEALNVILGPGPSTTVASSAFGKLAEELITLDYLTKRPGRVLFDHYFDNPFPITYLSFLVSHNPHLRKPLTIVRLGADLALNVAGFNRPDILTDMPAIKEFYEIKPNSPSGDAAALVKFAFIGALQAAYSLSYPKGASFTPSPSISLASGTIPMLVGTPLPFEFSLKVDRTAPGLIQYLACVETDWAKLGVNALVMIGIIIMILLLKRVPNLPPIPVPGGVPIPLLS
jgi:hypothetical protein